jgi:predicted amidohydrolase
MLRTHDPDGDYLYGIDIAVDPKHRGMKLSRRLYDARKQFVVENNLRGMIVGGRMPGFHRIASQLSPRQYLAKVFDKELRDPVITAQAANGFVPRGILRGYLPEDRESLGYAVLMEWRNPSWLPPDRPHVKSIRVAAVQYEMRPIRTLEEFETQCEFFIDTASEYRADFLLFPELITNQLLALVPAERPPMTARQLDRFTPRYVEFFGKMAMAYNVNILAGTHLTVEDEHLYNVAYLFHRDGRVDRQYKIHITPSEAKWWGVRGGDRIETFETDCGRIGIAICYDVEFPEVVRCMKAQGAEVVFVPYNTDIRSSHLRVKVCSQARAVENHLYLVTAGATGNLPQVEGADIHYAQSAIYTPSDIPFARDGIAAEATPNIETMLVHELDLVVLRKMESAGTVRPWQDRRKDLYCVTVKRPSGPLTI